MEVTVSQMDKPASILIVDDYVDALEAWRLFLRAAGFEVHTAADGVSALAEAVEHRPDLIVMDLELPKMSGLDVAKALRQRDDTRDIPLIVATGYSHAQTLANAQDVTIDAVIVKPCDPDQLVSEIRRLLDLSRRNCDAKPQG
jgi:CheY-like chemotaxis protein